jgi:site-specific DNA-cytosine methylase
MLFYVQTAIINKVLKSNPEAHFLVENVILDSENKDVVTSKLGVEPVYINSSLLSAQVRKRLYWFNWDQFLPTDTGKTFQSVLENGEAKMVTSFPLTATYYKRGSEDTRRRQFDRSQRPIVWLDDGSTRWLLPVECERLQTVPDGYTGAVSDTQRLKMLGNGFTVDIIAHLFKALIKS